MADDHILTAAIRAVYSRDDDYGTPEDNFSAIAKKWNAYIEKKTGDDPGLEAKDVAYMMIDLKTCRAADGDYNDDTDVDIAGYAESAARIQHGE